MENKKLKLSILDQSIVQNGQTAKQAIDATIETVKLAERLGYNRFWVSEHHNSNLIAGTTPEILMVKLADETEHIRIGSGGIMLPNHSAFKVAENFRMLELLFPNRIDLGMGRAPGGDRISASLLNPSNNFKEEDYLLQLGHLQHYFADTAGTKYGPLVAGPKVDRFPEQWILSSSGGSAKIAAQFGMGLVIAKFINGFASADIVDDYRSNFVPNEQSSEPQAFLAISVLCGETEEKAAELRKFVDYVLLQFEKGNFDHVHAPEVIEAYQFSPTELERIKYNSGRVVSGTPDQVKEQLLHLAEEFDVDEIMMSCMAQSQADRIRSFELLAEAFELEPELQD